jgi:hypothetical protein
VAVLYARSIPETTSVDVPAGFGRKLGGEDRRESQRKGGWVGGWAGTGDGGWGENDCVVCFYYSVGAGLRRKGAKRGSFDLHLTLDKGLDIS